MDTWTRAFRGWAAMLVSVSLFSVSPSLSPAVAKDFGPGDARVCDAGGCEPIMNRAAARELASFLYAGPQPERVWRPAAGSPSFELRLRLGRTIGVAGGRWLNRMRVHGLNCDRFRRGRWYRLPAEVAEELRQLTADRAGIPLRGAPRSC